MTIIDKIRSDVGRTTKENSKGICHWFNKEIRIPTNVKEFLNTPAKIEYKTTLRHSRKIMNGKN